MNEHSLLFHKGCLQFHMNNNIFNVSLNYLCIIDSTCTICTYIKNQFTIIVSLKTYDAIMKICTPWKYKTNSNYFTCSKDVNLETLL